MEEIWKVIDEYPDYMVSNMGRVKSIERNDYRGRNLKSKILTPRYNTRGYISVVLYKNGKPQTFRVNRLVAQVFIPNPENKPEVDHINANKFDNRVENLRWVTHKENMNNPIYINNLSKRIGGKNNPQFGRTGKMSPNSKPIIQFTLNGEFVRKWNCAADAERENGYNSNRIRTCCKDNSKTSGGYRWGYENEYERIQFKVFDLEMYRKKVA